jgi:sugar lactone lactonase YvrE
MRIMTRSNRQCTDLSRLVRVVTGLVALAEVAITAAGTLAQRGPTSSTPADFSSAKWVVSEGMDSPESVSYDADSGFLFVSQIGGQAAAKDGNGRISKLTLDGKVVAANWVTGLNGPKGQASHRGTLWVADIDEVVSINIKAGRVTSHLKIEGAQFLNDLAIAPDGTIYTSDSFGNRIYAIKDGKASVFFEGESIPVPNGVLVDGRRLIVAADGRPARGGAGGSVPATLVAINFATKQLTQVAKGPIGTPDGVEHDGHNGFVLSDVGTGRILQVAPDGAVKMLRQLAPQPADICYIPARHLLIVPHLGPNKVAAYELNELK